MKYQKISFYAWDDITNEEIKRNNLLKGLRSYHNFTKRIDEADYLILPFPYEMINEYTSDELISYGYHQTTKDSLKKLFEKCYNEAEQKKKKIIIIYYRDYEEYIDLPNVIWFRTSFKKSDQHKFKNLFCYPALRVSMYINGDFYRHYYNTKKIQTNTWNETPSIGFRGSIANYNFNAKIKVYLNGILQKNYFKTGYPYGYELRKKAVDIISKNKKITSNFTSYQPSLGVKKINNNDNQAYISSILNTHYSLVVRGHGNYSYRLFEVLSCGRIPVFIDTDSPIPFDFLVDYKDLFVWVKEDEIHNIDEILLEYHNNNKNSFIDLQSSMRDVFDKYLSVSGFAKNFSLHFWGI